MSGQILDLIYGRWIAFPIHVQIISGVIAFLFLLFFLRYFLPGWLFRFKLKRLVSALRRSKGQDDNELSNLFKRDRVLWHLWSEYQETLHKQRVTNPQTGVEEVTAIRSTLPAESFFSTSVLVDTLILRKIRGVANHFTHSD